MNEATRQRREAERKAALAAYIKKVVDDWPPLTPDQRDRLALLLNPRVPDVAAIAPVGGGALDEMLGDA